MSRTPAAQLARLKVTYQGWRITRPDGGMACQAVRRDSAGRLRLRAPNPGALEALIMQADHDHRSDLAGESP